MSIDNLDPTTLSRPDLVQLVTHAPAEQLSELMHGERRTAMLDTIFSGMPDVFRPDQAGQTNAVIHWRVGDRASGGEDTYELVVADGACRLSSGPHREPTLTLTISALDFLRMVTGNANPMMLFFRGNLKARGDLGLAMRLPKLFDTTA